MKTALAWLEALGWLSALPALMVLVVAGVAGEKIAEAIARRARTRTEEIVAEVLASKKMREGEFDAG